MSKDVVCADCGKYTDFLYDDGYCLKCYNERREEWSKEND